MFGLQLPFYSPLYRGTRNANQLRRKWAKATSAATLSIEGNNRRKIFTPRLTEVQIASEDGQQISALVDMSTVGATARELAQNIETISSVLGAYSTRVERLTPALARITVSFSPPRQHSPHTEGADLDLEQFPIPLDPTTNAHILLTKSLLIGGESESGKSNLVWYILSQLNTYQIPYRVWVIDPAGGVELADLEHSPLTRHYVDRIGNIEQIIDKFRESMDRRLQSMKKRGIRRHIPTRADPLEILIIDELLLCKSQLKGGDASSPLGETLASGRKALHMVIACSQLGQKDVIGQVRDLFPQRICLRTKSQDGTDAVLGTNATTDGANCHRITQRGEGYVFTDVAETFEKFRAPLVRETQSIAQGGITSPATPQPSTRAEQLRRRRSGRTFGYAFYDQSDPQHPQYRRPAYVGITHNPRQRFRDHESGPHSFPDTVWQSFIQSRTKVQAFPTWDRAKEWETQMIEYYQPKYNIQERRTA